MIIQLVAPLHPQPPALAPISASLFSSFTTTTLFFSCDKTVTSFLLKYVWAPKVTSRYRRIRKQTRPNTCLREIWSIRSSSRAVDNSPVLESETPVSGWERTEEFLSKCQAALEVVVPNNNRLPVRARKNSFQNKPSRNWVESSLVCVIVNPGAGPFKVLFFPL